MGDNVKKIIVDFNIALLSLNWYREKDPRTPLAIANIAAYLLENIGFEGNNDLNLLNYDVRENLSNAVHKIFQLSPKIIGISVYCWNLQYVKNLIFVIRYLGFDGKIVLGGPEITYGNADLKQEFPNADFFVRGDGEIAFTQIVEMIIDDEVISIPGIYSRCDNDFNGFARIISLDEAPSPFLNPKIRKFVIGNSDQGFIRWQTQRGCIYRCSFCAFPNGYRDFKHSDLPRIEQELLVFKKMGVKEVAVLDPIFFKDQRRGIRILELIEKICPEIRFEIQSRVEHINDEIIMKIQGLNIALEFGIQTLDPIVGREIKRLNNKIVVEKVLSELHDIGIEFECHLIYGLPMQTETSLTTDFESLRQYTDDVKLFPLVRLRGTALDLDLKNGKYMGQMIFSPIFPFEVIETRWMTGKFILQIKNNGCI